MTLVLIADGGGPGKRTPFTERPLNTDFGTPPADKAALWARRKAEYKTPVEVAKLVKLKRARAVLAEHKEAIQNARKILAFPSARNEATHKALIALADALESK